MSPSSRKAARPVAGSRRVGGSEVHTGLFLLFAPAAYRWAEDRLPAAPVSRPCIPPHPLPHGLP